MIEDIIRELNSTSSKIEQKEILEKHKNNDMFKYILLKAYDPFVMYNVNNTIQDKCGTNCIEDKITEIKQILTKLEKRDLTGNSARAKIMELVSTLTKFSADIFIGILNKDLKCNIGEKTINSVYKDLIPTFSVQLANKYKNFKNKKNSERIQSFYFSPKLDGIRAYWSINDKDNIYSRTGKPFVGLEHILKEIQFLHNKVKFDFIDGELLIKGYIFNEIQSVVLKSKNFNENEKKKTYFATFAVGNYKNTSEMVEIINKIKETYIPSLHHIECVDYGIISNNYEIIKRKCDELIGLGYEGIMLRSKLIPYSYKRDDYLLKYKPIDDESLSSYKVADLTIKEFYEGTGRKTGMLGSLLCVGNIDGKEIQTKIGSGFTDEERQEIWNNRQEYLDGEIEVKYQSITKNQNEENLYALQFGIKVAIKLDR